MSTFMRAIAAVSLTVVASFSHAADTAASKESTRTKMVTIMREELNWESLEPMYVDIYHETLTQDEVNGMIAFYKTPAGRAVIKKLPAVMQRSMAAVQQRMPGLIQKLQAATQDAQKELQK